MLYICMYQQFMKKEEAMNLKNCKNEHVRGFSGKKESEEMK